MMGLFYIFLFVLGLLWAGGFYLLRRWMLKKFRIRMGEVGSRIFLYGHFFLLALILCRLILWIGFGIIFNTTFPWIYVDALWLISFFMGFFLLRTDSGNRHRHSYFKVGSWWPTATGVVLMIPYFGMYFAYYTYSYLLVFPGEQCYKDETIIITTGFPGLYDNGKAIIWDRHGSFLKYCDQNRNFHSGTGCSQIESDDLIYNHKD